MHSISQSHTDPDAPIRLTDTDAAVARLSAVQKHYFQDVFVRHLVPRAHLQSPRPPLINIGTYIRTTAIDELVRSWMELAVQDGRRCQIVSLGAGSDSRFWRIATSAQKDHLAKYIEIDFPEVTSKKAMAIRKSKDLTAALGAPDGVVVSQGGTALHSPKFHLLPADLRLPPAQSLQPNLTATWPPATYSENSQPLLDRSLPTLLLFECVLVYMSPPASSAIINWFVEYFSANAEAAPRVLGTIVYEMFGLNDAFGKVMVENMNTRSVSLPGAEPYPSVSSLPDRLRKHQFSTANALTLRNIRKQYISREELERISQLEMLDEIEELDLVLDHYAITWGVKTFPDESHRNWVGWVLPRQEQDTLEDEDF